MAWGAIASVLLLGGLALTVISRSGSGRVAAALCVLCGWGATGACAGALSDAAAMPPGIASLVDRHADALAQGAEVTGRLASAVTVRAPSRGGPCAVEAAVAVRRIRIGRITHPVEGRLALRAAASCAEARELPGRWQRGDRVRLFARVAHARVSDTPGSFDAARRQRSRGLQGTAYVKSMRLVTVHAASRPGPLCRMMRRIDRFRASLLDGIAAAFGTTRGGRRAAAVSSALLLGERGELRAEDGRRLQESGLTHLLAVSGFNVAILSALCLAAAGTIGFRGRPAAALCLGALAAYLLLNRDESSVARAVLMAAALLGARGAGLWGDPRNSLGMAALLLLAQSPARALDAGFQLTFAATLALLELDLLHGAPDGRRIRHRVRDLAAATVAAMLVTAPIAAWHFNRVCPGALPANLLAGPLMSAAFVLVLCLVGAAPASPVAAHVIAMIVDRLVDLVFVVSDLVAAVPGLSYRRPTPHLAGIAAYMAALAAAVLLRRAGRTHAACAAWVLWGITAAWMAWPLETRDRPEGLRITALDVGQGDAVLVETPGGERLLVDAGGSASGDFDVGERVVSRALWHLGIASLDALVLTHADQDHVGGAAAVARNFDPPEIWVPPEWHERGGARARRLARAADAGTWIRQVRTGDALCLNGSRVEVLHPTGRGDPGDNERSIVLRLAAPGGGALMMGDAGAPAERRIDWGGVRARLLKVGHHGSRGGSSAQFLMTAGPRVALISCGRGNRFGHPHPQTLARLRSARVRVLRTDRHGTVWVELLPGATRLGGLFKNPDRRAWE